MDAVYLSFSVLIFEFLREEFTVCESNVTKDLPTPNKTIPENKHFSGSELSNSQTSTSLVTLKLPPQLTMAPFI